MSGSAESVFSGICRRLAGFPGRHHAGDTYEIQERG